MKGDALLVGIDSGSAAVALVLMNTDGELVDSAYELHNGKATETIALMLARLDKRDEGFLKVAATNSVPASVRADYRVDARIAYIEAARRARPDVRTLFVVGAERFSRVAFDVSGNYRRMRGNSACAAGTGSFLDQQATRLGLADSAELARLALSNQGSCPRIASRCSVFAKTDLIHAQQEGWTLAQICDGLCRGLARNIADTLFPGEQPEGPLLLAGGVALNGAVAKHLSEMAGGTIGTDPRGALFGAMGAVYRYLAASEKEAPDQTQAGAAPAAAIKKAIDIVSLELTGRNYENDPLSSCTLDYPDFTARESWKFIARTGGENNPVETDIYRDLKTLAAGQIKTMKGRITEIGMGSSPEGTNGQLAGEKPVLKAMLGFDIGSTSTKAALVGEDGVPLAGFYARTAGRPLEAAQAILEAIENAAARAGITLEISLCASTGSGRKLVGAILGSDTIIDEITAHARAAIAQDPKIDTIIEIGGQDSKFTSLKDGSVVFSQMNTVCAAGTGSFIEEQAARLGVPITEYAGRALRASSPLTSDRCTVFMERDLNHLRALGYQVDELLAAALFSVCDNYLTKVAHEGAIGKRIVFQGATAKNRALVAAFQRRLGKPIGVSKFCHLTGAIGAAIQARDEGFPKGATSFRGLHLHRLDFAFRSDECDGCNNRCKLHIVNVEGEEIVYGYLCGREKGDKTYVSKDRSGFDLLRERAAVLRQVRKKMHGTHQVEPGTAVPQKPTFPAAFSDAGMRASRAMAGAVATFSSNAIDTLTDAVYRAADYALASGLERSSAESKATASSTGDNKADGNPAGISGACYPVIGIPQALYLAEDAPHWQYFFETLGFPVRLGRDDSDALAEGKRTAGAEFCAPVAMLHGQSAALLRECDFVFLPTYLESNAEKLKDGEKRRFYCNYSQFAPAIVALATGDRERYLRPLAASIRGDDSGIVPELRDALRMALKDRGIPLPPPSEIRRVYREAKTLKSRAKNAYRELFLRAAPPGDDIAVVLAGRPYTLLSPGMNKDIPGIFSKQGIRAFFQDMIPTRPVGTEDALLAAYHWRYAVEVLETARFCALSDTHYAVLVSSFKCSPDSFAVESFKRILDDAGKPYLVLQVDEHDSSVGYETRIEAAVRSFRNHAATRAKTGKIPAVAPELAADPTNGKQKARKQGFPKNKTVLLPNWDPLVCELLASALRGQGIDARALEETPDAIHRAMSLNSGQCIPVSIIAREAMDYIDAKKLDPQRTALWMIRSLWPCNLPVYPLHIGGIFERYGKGMEKVEVYAGNLTFLDLSPQATLAVFHAYLTGGLVRKLLYRVRPYEIRKGTADAAARHAGTILADTLERGGSIVKAIRTTAALFEAVAVQPEKRPKVAIFGDFYSRDNDTFNQDLARAIEDSGGEVVVTPYIDYLKATCDAFFDHLLLERRFGTWAGFRSVLTAVSTAEKSYYHQTGVEGGIPSPWTNENRSHALEGFGFRPELAGECMDNALKILRIVQDHPDVALLVQANPAFCCPSIVTEAMAAEIEKVTGAAVVTITYDGTGSLKNDVIEPYLAFARERENHTVP